MRLSSTVALVLILLIPASVPAVDLPWQARFLGSVRWEVKSPWFGGFSAIDLAPDGLSFVALTDQGSLIRARMERDKDKIATVHLQSRHKLRDQNNAPLEGRSSDAEGVVLRPDGGVCVSFEFTNQTWCMRSPKDLPQVFPPHPDFRKLHPNRSLEALAIDPQGRLVVIPESTKPRNRPFRVYRLEQGTWHQAFTLPRMGGFLPVGADFGPDGRLYLLEREASIIGFRARVRSWDIQGRHPTDERHHLETFYMRHGNLEGLSVWQDAEGRIRLTMVSDNNFLDILRTEIVEYAIPAVAATGQTH